MTSRPCHASRNSPRERLPAPLEGHSPASNHMRFAQIGTRGRNAATKAMRLAMLSPFPRQLCVLVTRVSGLEVRRGELMEGRIDKGSLSWTSRDGSRRLGVWSGASLRSIDGRHVVFFGRLGKDCAVEASLAR
jgi:hypothetical protein